MKARNRKEPKERKEREEKRASKSFWISPVIITFIGILLARIMIVTNKK
jgi:hypothetical protein